MATSARNEARTLATIPIPQERLISDTQLADMLWNVVISEDIFDPNLAPIQGALKNFCKKLVGFTIIKSE